MQFELNDEQSALRDSLARLLADRYGFERRRALANSPEGHCQQTWAQLAELGLTGLPVAEADGGFGARAEDLLPVMQELGAALSLEPYLPLVLGATAVRLAGSEAQRAECLPAAAWPGRTTRPLAATRPGGCRPPPAARATPGCWTAPSRWCWARPWPTVSW